MNPSTNHDPPRRILLQAAAIADARGTLAAPGAVLVEHDADRLKIIATGWPQDVGEVADVAIVTRPDAVILPGLVNAHAHLDLTHLGPVEFRGDFTTWVDGVREGRARTPQDIAASVCQGVALSRAGGTAIVGDIAGVRCTVPTQTLRSEGLAGVSFLEVFGVGRTQQAAIEIMQAVATSGSRLESGVKFGLQPHAPYSCGPEVYRAAARLAAAMDLPLATHLAETREELEFVRSAGGLLVDMLRRLGVWDETISGVGVHAIDHVLEMWGGSGRPFIAAHVNFLDDRHLDVLAQEGLPVTVAYCPRASAYFGHHQDDAHADGARATHRYRDMLAAGINVALGTDSILCLDTPDRIGVLDDMRLLHRRDGADAAMLLRMATTNGARALGVRESLVTLSPGESAGLLAVRIGGDAGGDPLAQVLQNDAPPEWVAGPVRGWNDWFV